MKIDQLTFTRFVAAIIVVIFHYGLNIFPFNSTLISFIFEHGDLFVSYFFVLSGFVMIIAYYNQTFKYLIYVRKRIARIYPVHLVGILLLLVAYSLIDRTSPPFDVFFQATLTHVWIPRFSLIFNYRSWSLGVEMFFYVSFPLILSWFRGQKIVSLIKLVLVVWLATQLISYLMSQTLTGNHIEEFIFFNPMMHLSEFLIGMLFGTIFIKTNIFNSNINWALLLITVLALIVLIKFPLPWVTYKNGFTAPFFGLFIILLSSIPKSSLISRALNKSFFIRLGDISYAIYILQVPIYNLSYYIFRKVGFVNPLLSFYAYLCLLILFSYASYFAIEMPAKRIINKIKISY